MEGIKNEVCSFGSLYKAMTKCRRGVMWKDSVARYSNNGLTSTLKLYNNLKDDAYTIDDYHRFIIYEPKEREIVSTKLKDRVFQRSLCDTYLYDAITKSFIHDNCACQVNKGTTFAMDRLNCHMQRHFRKHGLDGYVLKCDIKNYFGSTPHATVKKVIRKSVADDWVYDHVKRIVDSFSTADVPGVGLGLGSQVTQLIQLAVLDRVDHYIKEELKVKRYIRYMDDFILIHHDKEYLKECMAKINAKVEELGLKLHPKKTQIFPLKQGINFLGFKFRLTSTGKVVRLLSKENVKKRKNKLRKFKKLVDDGRMTKAKADECYRSWKAHAKKGNSYKLLKRMDTYYKNLWKE